MQNAVADGRTIKEIRMASQNQLKYIREYNKAHYDRITVMVPKGVRNTIRERAKALGKSTNEYICGLIVTDLCGGEENESAD